MPRTHLIIRDYTFVTFQSRKISINFVLLTLLLTPIFLSAQDLQSEIEHVLAASFSSDLVASKTHPLIAWVENREGSRNIMMAETDKSVPRAVTDFRGDNGQALSNLIFHPDGMRLYFVRGGAPNRSGEVPNPLSKSEPVNREIWVTDWNGGARMVTEGYAPQLNASGDLLAFLRNGQIYTVSTIDSVSEASKLFEIRGSAAQICWHPAESDVLAFTSRRGDHAFVGLYRLGNDVVHYLDPTVDHDGAPNWSPDGKYLAFIREANEKKVLPFEARREGLPWSIMLYDHSDQTTKQIWQATPGAGSVFRFISGRQQLNWMDDRIVFPYEKHGWTQLYSITREGSDLKRHASDEFEVQYLSPSQDGRTIFFSSNQEDINRQHIWSISSNNTLPKRVTGGDGVEWMPVEAQGGKLFCLMSDHQQTAQVGQLAAGGIGPLTVSESLQHPSSAIEPIAVTFPAEDGLTIHGQLFLPPNADQKKKCPAVMFFHGGSRRQMLMGRHHRQYYSNAFALNQYLASRGFVVLSVNYRSGIGYGMEFREALDYGAQGASEYHDVLAGATYLRSRSDVDVARIGLWGGSYGGYLTALGLARNSDLFAAGVDIHGVHDWNVVIRNFVPTYQAGARAAFAEVAFASSPMADIDGWRSPVLVIHGDDDRNVPFSETVDLVEALRHLDVEVEQLIFPDEVHGFLLHRNWVAAYEATAEFFVRVLMP